MTQPNGQALNSVDYIITVTATEYRGGGVETTGSFTLTVRNPCVDPSSYTIVSPLVLPQYLTYRLTDYEAQGGLTIRPLSLLEIVTKPVQSDMCMTDISYEIVFDGEDSSSPSSPITVNVADRDNVEVTLFSDEFSLIGYRTFVLRANMPYSTSSRRLQVLPTSTPSDVPQNLYVDDPFADQAVINVIDPCINPDRVDASAFTNPEDWNYAGQLTWSFDAWTILPSGCDSQVEFYCKQISQPLGGPNLCVDGNFDSTTGGFSLETIDKDYYLPGTYTFDITGSVGSKSDIVTVTVVLVDPCPSTTLTLSQTFPDITEYKLRDSQAVIEWTDTDTLSKDTLVDCGEPTFFFVNSDFDRSTFDNNLFRDIRVEPVGTDSFTILY